MVFFGGGGDVWLHYVNREVSLYVITYENPYVVRAGERGQLSYVNLSTDFRRTF